jgi:hypothetical protein
MQNNTIINVGVFTDLGRGWVLAESNGQVQVELEGTGGTCWFACSAVRNYLQECEKQKRITTGKVVAAWLELCQEKELGHFPDMSQVVLPYSVHPHKLPKGLRAVRELGGYRPPDLPAEFAAWLINHVLLVKRNMRWARDIHKDMLETLADFNIQPPANVRFIKTGDRVAGAEQAHGLMSFVTFPCPDDLSIVPLEFFRGSEKERDKKITTTVTGERFMEIGNARLCIGLNVWAAATFPPIHFLTTKAEKPQPTPVFVD